MSYSWYPMELNSVLVALDSASPICTQLHTVLDVLESNRASQEPGFASKVIINYLQTKIDKGMPLWRVDEKFRMLEKALVRRGMLSFAAQIIQIRQRLSLPPSQVFPLRPRPDASASHRRQPPDTRLNLPLVYFKEESGGGGEVLPAYSII